MHEAMIQPRPIGTRTAVRVVVVRVHAQGAGR